jgi:hypothetical protein
MTKKGQFRKPVKKRRIFKPHYPSKDVSQEELEEIWSEPRDIPDDVAEKIRERAQKRKEVKPAWLKTWSNT